MSSRKDSESGGNNKSGASGEASSRMRLASKESMTTTATTTAATSPTESSQPPATVLNVNIVNEEDGSIAKACASTMSVLNAAPSSASAGGSGSGGQTHNTASKIGHMITSNLSLNLGGGKSSTSSSSHQHRRHHKATTNTTTSSHHGHGILSSIKATTLNASKIINKTGLLSARSSSPHTSSQATIASDGAASSSKKPIDLETHIITNDFGSMKPTSESSSECSTSESSSSSSSSSSSGNEDELAGGGSETDNELTPSASALAKDDSHASTSLVKKPAEKRVLDRKITTTSLGAPSMSKNQQKKKKKKSFLSISLFEDDDDDDDDNDDDENMDSMTKDLDEECFHSTTSSLAASSTTAAAAAAAAAKAAAKKTRMRERRQSKINSAAVARCSLKTLSNLPASATNLAHQHQLQQHQHQHQQQQQHQAPHHHHHHHHHNSSSNNNNPSHHHHQHQHHNQALVSKYVPATNETTSLLSNRTSSSIYQSKGETLVQQNLSYNKDAIPLVVLADAVNPTSTIPLHQQQQQASSSSKSTATATMSSSEAAAHSHHHHQQQQTSLITSNNMQTNNVPTTTTTSLVSGSRHQQQTVSFSDDTVHSGLMTTTSPVSVHQQEHVHEHKTNNDNLNQDANQDNEYTSESSPVHLTTSGTNTTNSSLHQQQPHQHHSHHHHHHNHNHSHFPSTSSTSGLAFMSNQRIEQVKEETSSDLDQQTTSKTTTPPASILETTTTTGDNNNSKLLQLAYFKQDSVRSAPPAPTNGNEAGGLLDGDNNGGRGGDPNGTGGFLQRPLEMSMLNSSFASSTNTCIGVESSYHHHQQQQQHQQHGAGLLGSKFLGPPNNSSTGLVDLSGKLMPIRTLHKSMTKGSKAMRIMGNNSLSIGNGPLKTTSAVSISQKSTSSFGRGGGNNTKKVSQKRLFFKNGNINISRSNIDKRRRRYLVDIFTTLIDLKWRYNIIVFLLGFFMSWTFFAVAWYVISYVHGDLDEKNLGSPNRTACISGVHGFAGAILFSIETQQTIGYGVRYTTEKCPEAIFVMMIQSSVGVMIQSFMVGVVFAKLSRPKKRSETLMFSKNAVISLRDGRLCLICRVGDMRKSHIVEAHVRMYLIKKKVTLEGEILPLHMYDLNVGWDKGLDRLFLVWPLTIEHNIDENSPLWTVSAEDLRQERFEIAVILEGIVESTGMTTQARSSYLVNEILWGHRFEKLITFQKEDGTYKIDYSRFDVTVPIDTPTCSAREWAELREQEKFYNQQTEFHSMSNPSIFTSGSTAYLGASNGGPTTPTATNGAAAAAATAADLRKRNSFNRQITDSSQQQQQPLLLQQQTSLASSHGNNQNGDESENGASSSSASQHQQPVVTKKLIENYGNAIKMIVEDHSNLSKPAATTTKSESMYGDVILTSTAEQQHESEHVNLIVTDPGDESQQLLLAKHTSTSREVTV